MNKKDIEKFADDLFEAEEKSDDMYIEETDEYVQDYDKMAKILIKKGYGNIETAQKEIAEKILSLWKVTAKNREKEKISIGLELAIINRLAKEHGVEIK